MSNTCLVFMRNYYKYPTPNLIRMNLFEPEIKRIVVKRLIRANLLNFGYNNSP